MSVSMSSPNSPQGMFLINQFQELAGEFLRSIAAGNTTDKFTAYLKHSVDAVKREKTTQALSEAQIMQILNTNTQEIYHRYVVIYDEFYFNGDMKNSYAKIIQNLKEQARVWVNTYPGSAATQDVQFLNRIQNNINMFFQTIDDEYEGTSDTTKYDKLLAKCLVQMCVNIWADFALRPDQSPRGNFTTPNGRTTPPYLNRFLINP